MAVTEEAIGTVNAQGIVTESGRVAPAQEFATEAYYRAIWRRWNPKEVMDSMVT